MDNSFEGSEVRLELEYYTDPLCAWSWGFEPQWRRLRYEFAAQLRWRYRMGGMLSDWQRYNDPLNDISRPVQMGPLWHQIAEVSGMPLDDRVWLENPPTSSYPACIAVKAAELQSPEAGEHYLRRLREAVMRERRNVARRDVLLALADELADDPGFDAGRFREEIAGAAALDLFRDDLARARALDIGRFPTLTLRRPGEATGLLLVGYRPYPVLLAALSRLLPVTARRAESASQYAAYWKRITPREVAEALEEPPNRQALLSRTYKPQRVAS